MKTFRFIRSSAVVELLKKSVQDLEVQAGIREYMMSWEGHEPPPAQVGFLVGMTRQQLERLGICSSSGTGEDGKEGWRVREMDPADWWEDPKDW